MKPHGGGEMAIRTINGMGAYSEASKNVQTSKTTIGNGMNTSFDNAARNKENFFNEKILMKEQAIASKVKATLSEANIKATRTRCEFSIDEPTHRVSIKVIDRVTDEVIREIPPEESLDVLAKIWELAGLLVDEKR